MAIVVPKGSHGAYREQIVLDARSVVRAPAGKTHAEAATLPMNGLTARQSLDLIKLSRGQVVAVTGAAGAYGGYVIQLAKSEGLTVIADASEKDEKLVASLGADIVVRRGDDVASRIRKHFPQGVDGLADGAVLNALVIPAVRDGGAFTSVRGFQGARQRDIRFTTTMVRSYAQEFEKLDRLRQQVEAGEIALRVAEVYPPERAAEAHRRLEAGGTRGRLVNPGARAGEPERAHERAVRRRAFKTGNRKPAKALPAGRADGGAGRGLTASIRARADDLPLALPGRVARFYRGLDRDGARRQGGR
jgi:NADPH:quinone reductase